MKLCYRLGAVLLLALGALFLVSIASAQPPVPHSLEGRDDCLACHQTGVVGAPRVAEDHTGRTNESCDQCHAPIGVESAGMPTIPHPVEGRETCLICHEAGVGGASKIPDDHEGRTDETCQRCHVEAGTTPVGEAPISLALPLIPHPTEGREACLTCHSGPPHPDDETYFASAHGQRYLAEGAEWDWSKPLVKGNYPVPTCAYCHMRNGRHQVADKAIWKFGIREVNPKTAENQVKRQRWLAVCADCHETAQARGWLEGLDRERKQTWAQLYQAEDVLRALRGDDLLHPQAGDRPPYPIDWWEEYLPLARVGFYEGQASAFYNVSRIERDYFEMWYFDSLAAYKGAAHGATEITDQAHRRLGRNLERLRREAAVLRELGRAEEESGHRVDPRPLWLRGPYTEYNRERN